MQQTIVRPHDRTPSHRRTGLPRTGGMPPRRPRTPVSPAPVRRPLPCRVEDPELIDGRSTYVDDLRIPGTTHAVFVRSPLAHATITAIDTSNAERSPGVLAVHTAATLGREWVPSFAEVHELIGHGPLADGVVRFVGDPVALVVAETRAQAVDAAELVDVDYDLLDVVEVEVEFKLR